MLKHLFVLVCIGIVTLLTNAYTQNVFTVTKTGDPDPFTYPYNYVDSLCDTTMYGTLQWAIRKANDAPDSSIIQFNIAGADTHAIVLNYALPILNKPITIDGTTQTGYDYNDGPLIIIDGTNIPYNSHCFNTSGWSERYVIKGLWLRNFYLSWGIIIYGPHSKIINNIFQDVGGWEQGYYRAPSIYVGAPYCIIQGNILGTDITETQDYGTNAENIALQNQWQPADSCLIGGAGLHEANIVANSSATGVAICNGKYNRISRNKIYNNTNGINLTLYAGPSWWGNQGKPAPVIDTIAPTGILYGTSEANDTIEIFGSTGAHNANEYITTVVADTNGDWNAAISNYDWDYLVATASDDSSNTSELSSPFEIEMSCLAEAGSNDTICLGDTVQLMANDGFAYIWEASPTDSSLIGQDTLQNPLVSPSTSTTYTVTVSNAMGCTETDTIIITLQIQVTATQANQGPTCYASLREVFNAINAGTHKGAITIKINGNSTETATAVLYQSGYGGNSSYTSVNIFPTGNATIQGNFDGYLIDLNGADSVTIDGRINETGTTKSLTITNTNGGGSASAIRFVNVAQNNTIKYCILKSSNGNSGSGTVFFSTASTGGNSNNTITYNDITTASTNTAERPICSIYSSGTAGTPNINNTISHNNFYNFFRSTATSYGIRAYTGTSAWTIDNNSFYETDTMFTPVNVALGSNNSYIVIEINNTTSNNFIITHNTIGGRDSDSGGGLWLIKGESSNYFYGIQLSVGASPVCRIDTNTIKNIYQSSINNNSTFIGIRVNAGKANIRGNTIGDNITMHAPVVRAVATAVVSGGAVTGINITSAGNGYTVPPPVAFSGGGGTGAVATSIISGGQVTGFTITNGGTGYTSAPTVTISGTPLFRGMYFSGTGIINATSNTITGITTSGAFTASTASFYGIESTNNAQRNINNNTISNINLSNASDYDQGKQDAFGIYSSSNSVVDISGNTIESINNAAVGTSSSYIKGIYVTYGSNTITGNTISNLYSACRYASSTALNSTIVGIQNQSNATGSKQVISGNAVYNITSTAPTQPVRIRGIHLRALADSNHIVEGNFIHSFSVASNSTSAYIFGISLETGSATISNNIVNLGTSSTNGTQIFGIWDPGTVTNNYGIFHNTVYISGGTANTSTLTYGLFSNAAANSKIIKNNIFHNARSSGSGTNLNFAIRLSDTTGATLDYNDYYATGTAGTICRLGSTNYSTLAAWQGATSLDSNSIDSLPHYSSLPPGSEPEDYKPTIPYTGDTGVNIQTDFSDIQRSTPPTIGAFEVSDTLGLTCGNPILLNLNNLDFTPLTYRLSNDTVSWFKFESDTLLSVSVIQIDSALLQNISSIDYYYGTCDSLEQVIQTDLPDILTMLNSDIRDSKTFYIRIISTIPQLVFNVRALIKLY